MKPDGRRKRDSDSSMDSVELLMTVMVTVGVTLAIAVIVLALIGPTQAHVFSNVYLPLVERK